jgi:hypothetical protein
LNTNQKWTAPIPEQPLHGSGARKCQTDTTNCNFSSSICILYNENWVPWINTKAGLWKEPKKAKFSNEMLSFYFCWSWATERMSGAGVKKGRSCPSLVHILSINISKGKWTWYKKSKHGISFDHVHCAFQIDDKNIGLNVLLRLILSLIFGKSIVASNNDILEHSSM